jgi:hypothetical protein
VVLPFEQVVYERLIDENDSIKTNIQYGAIINDSLQKQSIAPHLFFTNLTSIGTKTMAFNDGATKTTLSSSYYQPSHSGQVALTFGSEYEEYTGVIPAQNLYSYYHSAYINGLFNIKRRVYSITVENLPLVTLTDIELNDILQIGINYYRINKYTTELTSGKVQFELYNISENDLRPIPDDITYLSYDLNFNI